MSAESSGGSKIRIVLVDDEPLLRRSLRIAIDREPDLEVVGEAGTGISAVHEIRRVRPDIVLMDIRMPEEDGIEATQRIGSDSSLSPVRVIVLTMFELDEYVYRALRAGASAFLLKDAHPEQLVDAIRRVHLGESLFAPRVLARLVDNYLDNGVPRRSSGQVIGLTEREVEVLALVGKGLSNTEISDGLSVTIHTVKSHVGHLLSKLGARDRAQLVIAAYSHGLVGREDSTRAG
jgi:DNA-binding NarL/FixJ family response regulator